MKKSSIFVSLLLFLGGCAPQLSINYLEMSVPEEGGIKFTQYTRDDESVVGPWVGLNEVSGKLQWYAAPFIGISPDGEHLAYVARVNGFDNLYMKKIHGGRTTIQRTFNRNIYDMSFSPDSKEIAFTEKRNGNMNIHLINSLEGAAVQSIAASQSDELGPSFSTDGKKIFFTKREGSRFYIWSVNKETSLLTQYGEGFTPVMTPDGSSLIITRNSRDGFRGEIWMLNIKKGIETLILSDPYRGFSSPDISPDGKRIVCVGSTPESPVRPQNLDIYTVNIDGTQLTQLTYHAGNDTSPQWGPNGKDIFFISQRGNVGGRLNVWKLESRQ